MEKVSSQLHDAMGVKEQWYDEAVERTLENLKVTEYLSEALLRSAEEVRDEMFGEVTPPIPLSEYERKLILVGYMIGLHRTAGIREAMREIMGIGSGDE